MKKLVVLLVLVFAFNIYAGSNYGHRVGAGRDGYHSDIPENSISALKAVTLGREGEETPLQFHRKFIYLETDIHETADKVPVLFHDKYLKKMLPDNDINEEAIEILINDPEVIERYGKKPKYKYLRVKHLTLEQLQTLVLAGSEDERVPSLEYFLEKAKEWGLVKPITIETKRLQSDEARQRIIDLMVDYRENYTKNIDLIFEEDFDLDHNTGVSFLSFTSHFKRSFGKSRSESRTYWCEQFIAAGFPIIYTARRHSKNQCRESQLRR